MPPESPSYGAPKTLMHPLLTVNGYLDKPWELIFHAIGRIDTHEPRRRALPVRAAGIGNLAPPAGIESRILAPAKPRGIVMIVVEHGPDI